MSHRTKSSANAKIMRMLSGFRSHWNTSGSQKTEHKIRIVNFILREMAKLIRESDGEGESGARSEAIQWNEDGTFDKVISNRPVVGCSMLVGSVTARSYSNRDWWLTTKVTEILEEKEEDGALYVRFKTGNSIYGFWS